MLSPMSPMGLLSKLLSPVRNWLCTKKTTKISLAIFLGFPFFLLSPYSIFAFLIKKTSVILCEIKTKLFSQWKFLEFRCLCAHSFNVNLFFPKIKKTFSALFRDRFHPKKIGEIFKKFFCFCLKLKQDKSNEILLIRIWSIKKKN